MPVLGAFVWGLIIGIGRLLAFVAIRWGPTIVGNLLVYFGLRFVTTTYGAPLFNSWFASAFGALADQYRQILGYVGVDEAITMMLSAYLYKVAHSAVTHMTMAQQATP